MIMRPSKVKFVAPGPSLALACTITSGVSSTLLELRDLPIAASRSPDFSDSDLGFLPSGGFGGLR
jgi:hypothetical protein